MERTYGRREETKEGGGASQEMNSRLPWRRSMYHIIIISGIISGIVDLRIEP